ncbi:tetratricopeptide repeat protein [Thiohalorhabdus methylotrophus]|uniref:Tetratricopeptide repeat protein n=1 Tax=Thiohalorhabdus methylotrophus TaxID=3242694 RepID=A0ABV4TVI2_9GAMM
MHLPSAYRSRSLRLTLLGSLFLGMGLASQAHAQQKAAPYVGQALDGRPCSSFQGTTQGYGPYDYRKYRSKDRKLKIVEGHHFTTEVKRLKDGESSETPVGDLNYTLMAFPNHHRALYAMIQLHTGGAREKWSSFKQFSARPTPECFLQRAAAFTPEDADVYLLYGIYLHRLEKPRKAIEKYRKALEIRPKFSEAWYNLGLAYLDVGKPKEARKAAHKAYERGYPLPGLRKKLAEAGYGL